MERYSAPKPPLLNIWTVYYGVKPVYKDLAKTLKLVCTNKI
jgi:hypothetical protein